MARRWVIGIGVVLIGFVMLWLALGGLSFGAASLVLQLRALHGQTGLDPLDPVQPLVQTDVLGIESADGFRERARVRFTYADGVSRDYDIWLADRYRPFGGWRRTGLDILFAPYEELPVLPLAGEQGPLRIGSPQRLTSLDTLVTEPPELDTRTVSSSVLTPWPVWSPIGEAVLVGFPPGDRPKELWLVPVDGSAPTRLAAQVTAAQWTPDGRAIAYQTGAPQGRQPAALTLADRTGRVVWSIAVPSRGVPFAMTDDGVLFVRDRALWRMRYDAAPGSEPEGVGDVPGIKIGSDAFRTPLAPTPDGTGLAYPCHPDVCLVDRIGGEPRRIALSGLGLGIAAHPTPAPFGRLSGTPQIPSLPPRPVAGPPLDYDPEASWPALRMAWSPDGQRLAVVRSARPLQPRLALIARTGQVLAEHPAGPNGPVETPHWTPDGQYLFLPSFPENGRRIVVQEAATGALWDLTPPIWDTFFVLSSDGRRLLLTNDRGGFWITSVEQSHPAERAGSLPRPGGRHEPES